MNFSSKLIDEAVEQMSSLPGIGKKTALRLVLNLLNRDLAEVERFSNSFTKMRNNIRFCVKCHNISEEELCGICSNKNRDQSLICVVEDIRDVISIEKTNQFSGYYHVLGGIISPMDGIGPNDLNIESLLTRVQTENISEVIFALSTTMEGDTTNFYLHRKLAPLNIKTSVLSRGVSVGDELHYADEITLGRSIVNRTPFDFNLSK